MYLIWINGQIIFELNALSLFEGYDPVVIVHSFLVERLNQLLELVDALKNLKLILCFSGKGSIKHQCSCFTAVIPGVPFSLRRNMVCKFTTLANTTFARTTVKLVLKLRDINDRFLKYLLDVGSVLTPYCSLLKDLSCFGVKMELFITLLSHQNVIYFLFQTNLAWYPQQICLKIFGKGSWTLQTVSAGPSEMISFPVYSNILSSFSVSRNKLETKRIYWEIRTIF